MESMLAWALALWRVAVEMALVLAALMILVAGTGPSLRKVVSQWAMDWVTKAVGPGGLGGWWFGTLLRFLEEVGVEGGF